MTATQPASRLSKSRVRKSGIVTSLVIVGIIQGVVVFAVSQNNSTIVSAVIAGVFLLVNTLLTITLTRRSRNEEIVVERQRIEKPRRRRPRTGGGEGPDRQG